MDASNPMTPQNQQKREDSRRKRKAILAGGVVLGLGAAVTLAAWSDDVFASGTFNTGAFKLQGNTTGDHKALSGWDDYDGGEGGVASLSFQLEATNMSPDQTVFAPLSIATSAETTLNGTFELTDVTSDGPFASALTYSVFTTEGHGANCSPAESDELGAAWASGTASEEATTSGAELSVSQKRGNSQNLCIAVTLGNQGQVEDIISNLATEASGSTSVTWKFTGTSIDQ